MKRCADFICGEEQRLRRRWDVGIVMPTVLQTDIDGRPDHLLSGCSRLCEVLLARGGDYGVLWRRAVMAAARTDGE